ncbi:MAG TPA: dihydrofolate reductase family protein [Myxococcaceae bacterium]|nr:dihydrofolate reductase family protein [Myxococcaceae bacterium]
MDRPRVSGFLGASLDGFIADADGGLGFLEPFEQEEHGYAAFYASVDTLLMGRKTYETVLGFGAWPFGDKRVAVLSRSARAPRFGERFLSGDPHQVLATLAAQGARHVYADGGEVVTQLLAAGCLDRLVVSIVPVVVGTGIRLFASSPGRHRLTLESTQTYPSGLVQLRYAVGAAASDRPPRD